MKESTKRKVVSIALLRFIPMCIAICIAMNLFGVGNVNATGLSEENMISETGTEIGGELETHKDNDVTKEETVGVEAETNAETEVEAEATVKTEEEETIKVVDTNTETETNKETETETDAKSEVQAMNSDIYF